MKTYIIEQCPFPFPEVISQYISIQINRFYKGSSPQFTREDQRFFSHGMKQLRILFGDSDIEEALFSGQSTYFNYIEEMKEKIIDAIAMDLKSVEKTSIFNSAGFTKN